MGATIGWLLVGGVALAWLGVLVSALRAISARSETHGGFGGALGDWMRAESDRSTRRTLVFLTGCLVLMLAQRAFLG